MKDLLFRDMHTYIEYWSKVATSSLLDADHDFDWVRNPDAFIRVAADIASNKVNRDDLEFVFSECFGAVATSFLTILDGATAMSDNGRLYLVDENGDCIGDGLHDEFASFLLDRTDVAEE